MTDTISAGAILADLAVRPTAPYHEERVAAAVAAWLRRLGLTPTADRWGNLIVRIRRGVAPYPVALMAHMDHPGLEVIEPGDDGLPRARVLGGLQASLFADGQGIRFYPGDADEPVVARAREVHEHGPRQREITLEPAGAAARLRPGDFGTLDLPDFYVEDDRLYARQIDDLGGCAAILGAVARIVRNTEPCDVFAVFTRAEEVGLVGAHLLGRDGTLPHDTIVVSLETSPALPGAVIGEGPVIRVGDRMSAFHPAGDALLRAARELITERNGIPVQRQLMSGGSCEATAFNLLGYRTTGVAIPLGNYHNRTPEGRAAPEYIAARDLEGAAALLAAIPEAALTDPAAAERERREEQTQRHEPRLSATAGRFAAVVDGASG